MNSVFDRLPLWGAYLGSGMLVLLVLLVGIDVLLRYWFSMPIEGSQDLSELGLLSVVSCAMAYGAATDAHVSVDLIQGNEKWQTFCHWVVSVLSIAVLGALVWRSCYNAIDAWEYDDVTTQLRIPLWPFYLVFAAGFALHVLVLISQLLAPRRASS